MRNTDCPHGPGVHHLCRVPAGRHWQCYASPPGNARRIETAPWVAVPVEVLAMRLARVRLHPHSHYRLQSLSGCSPVPSAKIRASNLLANVTTKWLLNQSHLEFIERINSFNKYR